VAALRRRTDQASQRWAQLSPFQTGRAPALSATTGARFDGMGQLSRVASNEPGDPQYVLLDATGQPNCYVTPAPGVNLRYYVGQRVGVNGTTGYIPEQRARHVMASHVQPLPVR